MLPAALNSLFYWVALIALIVILALGRLALRPILRLVARDGTPELFTGIGATALAALPDIALGDVLGSCMFNLLILSLMDAVQPEPISARAHQGHALSIGVISSPVGLPCLSTGRCHRWNEPAPLHCGRV